MDNDRKDEYLTWIIWNSTPKPIITEFTLIINIFQIYYYKLMHCINKKLLQPENGTKWLTNICLVNNSSQKQVTEIGYRNS